MNMLDVPKGAARDAAELGLVPALIRAHGDVANCCVNIPVDANGPPPPPLPSQPLPPPPQCAFFCL